MKRAALIASIIVLSFSAAHVFGDGKKKKQPVNRRVWDPYSCCHNMADTPHKTVLLTEEYVVPEFFSYDTLHHGDTSFVYECYDSRDSVIDVDTLRDFGRARYISLFKKYIDPYHTYTDHDGTKKLLPVSVIAKRYDRVGKDKWMSISYPGNKYAELKEYRNNIVRADTFYEKGSAATIISIYNYYKVSSVK